VPSDRQTGGTVLAVDNLSVRFRTAYGLVEAVRNVSWSVSTGETLVILGESGSGKTVSVLAVAGLLPSTATIEGSARFRDREILEFSKAELRRYRANDIGMVFQDPLASLNPCFRVGDQLAEILRVHRGAGRREARQKAVELIEAVRIRDPERRARQFPHELSGGMRQRIVIASAIALHPPVLLADEPTTALDTSVRTSVLEMIQDLRNRLGMAVVLITHDVGVAAAVADRLAVMYAGRIVEYGPVASVFGSPAHPYTAALLGSLPRGITREPLQAIEGVPPDPRYLPSGCPFHPRCRFAQSRCGVDEPARTEVLGSTREAACHFAEELHAQRALELR